MLRCRPSPKIIAALRGRLPLKKREHEYIRRFRQPESAQTATHTPAAQARLLDHEQAMPSAPIQAFKTQNGEKRVEVAILFGYATLRATSGP